MSKKVSILIPIYNCEQFIEECLCSIFEQSYDNLEIILANDASPDNSMAIVHETTNRYPQKKAIIKFIENKENKGVAYTRNLLIKNATGEYIYFVDSDDFVESDTIESLVVTAEKEQADISRCNFYKYQSGKSQAIIRPKERHKDAIEDCLNNAVGLNSLCLMLIRRSLFSKNSLFFPEEINGCEDFLMTVKLFYFANKVVDTPKPLYYYRLDNSCSITHQESKFRKDSCKAINEIILFLKEKQIFEKYYDLCMRLKFTSKQHYLINKSIRDVEKYINTFPESNSYYKYYPYNTKQKILFFLAEKGKITLLKVILQLL